MERGSDNNQPACPEDGSQLNRNRSFKSKQLVRSKALRESHSPPRTVSPSDVRHFVDRPGVKDDASRNFAPTSDEKAAAARNFATSDESKNCTSNFAASDEKGEARSFDEKRNNIIVISDSYGLCHDDDRTVDADVCCDSAGVVVVGPEDETHAVDVQPRARRSPRDLLSRGPRVHCVCAPAASCTHCRRRKLSCPMKQDSGISVDCADCDPDTAGGPNGDTLRNNSLDVEPTEQHCGCTERREKPRNHFSKSDSADDKSDLSGIELVNFIKSTLNKNPRDRMTLLKIEKDLYSLVHDSGRCVVRFPVMTSYGRMLVHRCAALFHLSHHIDNNHKSSVLVSKTGTAGGRIPCTPFKQWCTTSFPPSDTQTKFILKRAAHSLDECSPLSPAGSRSKSLEQRERDYERVRRRIFSTDNCSQDESQLWLSGPVKLLTPDSGRNKLLKVSSLETAAPPTRSVSKSHSFGGYEPREDTHRVLSRQGDLASSSWRLSPSSSGYKTLSVRSSDSPTTSPTACLSPPGAVVWAVSGLAAVPAGALILHPQTGRPLSNADGSLYRYDPQRPPLGLTRGDSLDPNNEKRRGRLEKQQSFIDNETECIPTDCRKGCYCDTHAEPQIQQQQPPSPLKEQTVEPTNHVQGHEPPANQRTALVEPTNHRPPSDKPANQDVDNGGYVQQMYPTQYRGEEPAYAPYIQPDIHTSKGTPVPLQEHAMRPLSVSGVLYQPTFPYQHCRPDGTVHAQMYAPPMEEKHEHTFRIDPSYPYGPVECPGFTPCIDTHRSYGVPYGQSLEPTPPAYPLGGVVLQQPMHHYQYQQLQWPQMPQLLSTQMQSNCAPIQKPATPPSLYLPHQDLLYHQQIYAQNQVYPMVPYPMVPYHQVVPQLVPQSYPGVPHVYPVVERQDSRHKYDRRSLVSACSASPPPSPRQRARRGGDEKEERMNSQNRQNSNELAMKIQQIKEQMAALNTHDKDRHIRDGKERARRNNGNGILGSYPTNNYGGNPQNRNMGPVNDESQLSTAARAIVNSIRNMQAKNTQQPDSQRPRTEPVPQHASPSAYPRRDYRRDGYGFRPQYGVRQMTPGTWCRRSPAPVHPAMNQPRRPPPDSRNPRRQ